MTDFDKTCFVIMPFGKNGTPERTHYDMVFGNIKNAVERCGVDLVCKRADDVNKPGTIIDDIILDLYRCEYVIADLSSLNPNVVYELGIRHSLKEKTIIIAEKNTKLPFDLGSERTIFYDSNDHFLKGMKSLGKSILEINEDENHKDSRVLKVVEPLSKNEMNNISEIDYKAVILEKIVGNTNKAYTSKLDNDHYLLGIDVSLGDINKDNFEILSFNKLVESTLREYNLNRKSILGYYNPKNYKLGITIEKEIPSYYYFLDFNHYGIVSFSFVARKFENRYLDINNMTSVVYDFLRLSNHFFKNQKRIYINSYFDTPKTSSIVDYYPNLNGVSIPEFAQLEYNNSEAFEYENLYDIRTDYIKEHVIKFISNFLRICNYQEDPTKFANYFYDKVKLEKIN